MNPETCPQVRKYDRYAAYKENGRSMIVGSKGLEYAVHWLKQMRRVDCL
ncbi:hypothetical protein [Fimbriiglobus ruber]|uniref:Uncharacterized protein n=1 Tax=Fimbriiglobus ruber TaxID=1908690 RepID=A0A225EBN7_9BACT|nr:hypothetical protein [Fimbriiglobus ruber]OWK45787.1 hypothetical protein FRUB_02118 [Fimbriiglobus ruber]